MDFKKGQKVFFSHYVNDLENDNSESGIIKDIKYWPANNMPIYLIETEQGNILETNRIYSTEEEMNSKEYGIDEEGKWFSDMLKQSTDQPTQPKPTTELTDDMTWAWSEQLKQWIAVKKDDTYSVLSQDNIAQNTQQAVNYTTAACEKILASMLNKELLRSQIEDEEDYFNCAFASKLIKLSGVDLDTKEPKFVISNEGYEFLKKCSLMEINKKMI